LSIDFWMVEGCVCRLKDKWDSLMINLDITNR
jgi:hypothetical protein